MPDVSQTVIITRMEGRTPVPPKEKIHSLASHNATMVIFLSTGLLKELSAELVKGGYSENTTCGDSLQGYLERRKLCVAQWGH